MTVIASDLKEELMSIGIWGDFVRRRGDVRSERGISAAKANVIVMQEFADAGRVPEEFVERIRPRGRPRKDGGGAKDSSAAAPEKPKAAPVQTVASVKARGGVPFGTMDSVIGLYGISKADFNGKDCSFTVAFGWACDNLLVRDVSPSDAPSAKAWTMLVMMRYSQTYLSDMMKAGVGTLLRKAETEDVNGSQFDGQEAYDLAGAIAQEVPS